MKSLLVESAAGLTLSILYGLKVCKDGKSLIKTYKEQKFS
jgi:hypothetical protein